MSASLKNKRVKKKSKEKKRDRLQTMAYVVRGSQSNGLRQTKPKVNKIRNPEVNQVRVGPNILIEDAKTNLSIRVPLGNRSPSVSRQLPLVLQVLDTWLLDVH
ncbi:hypothetical protein M9H77_08590 [Catharanthus roseus]|uniref:Uncharacterized protein n=1 Tax=Catharanthus roseus TaxID=4058 RepID=A0ACC0BYC9_CATRO|nr:hypothetical protein M9H77_08590 [Catharanthus roseus]